MIKKLFMIGIGLALFSCTDIPLNKKGLELVDSKTITSIGKNQVTIINQNTKLATFDNVQIENNGTKTTLLGTTCKELYQIQTCTVDLSVKNKDVGVTTIKIASSFGDIEFPIKIDTTSSPTIATDVNAFNNAGDNSIVFVNNVHSPILVQGVKLTSDLNSASFNNQNTCTGKTLDYMESCIIGIKLQYATQEKDKVVVSSDAGDFDFNFNVDTFQSPKVSVEQKILDLVGDNIITVTNNIPSAIAITNVTASSHISGGSCMGKTLNYKEQCTVVFNLPLHVKTKDTLAITTDAGAFSSDFDIDTTSASKIELSSENIAKTGVNVLTLTSHIATPIVFKDIKFNSTTDQLDTSMCFGKTLRNQDTCTIQLTANYNVKNLDKLTLVTEFGNYNFDIAVDTTHSKPLGLSVESIAETGIKTIELKNFDENTTIVIKGIKLTPDQTGDELDKKITFGNSGCGEQNKSLPPHYGCNIGINVDEGVAGLDNIEVVTNLGTFNFVVKVNNAGENSIIPQPQLVNTTKEKRIEFKKRGAPIHINSFALEKDNKTLTLKDSLDAPCTDHTIARDGSCYLIATAKSGTPAITHIVTLLTSNKYLQPQVANVIEQTNVTGLQWYLNGTKVTRGNVLAFDKPEPQVFTLENNGSSDLSIKNVLGSFSSIGEVVDNQCDGKHLQPDDSCTFTLNVATTAHGAGNIHLDTVENLIDNDFSVAVKPSTLVFKDGTGDAHIHANARGQQLTIVNSGDFNAKIDKIEYNYGLVQLDDRCSGILNAHTQCVLNVSSSSNIGDTPLNIFEFNGEASQHLALHVGAGAYMVLEPQDSHLYDYVKSLHDGWFYQIYTVHNGSDKPLHIDFDHPYWHVVGVPTDDYATPWFTYYPNCFTGTRDLQGGATCAVIMQLGLNGDVVNQINDLKNQGKKEAFVLSFADFGQYFLSYQPTITQHMEHRDFNYQPNQFISNTPLPNSACGVSVGSMISHIGIDYAGLSLKMGLDRMTVIADIYLYEEIPHRCSVFKEIALPLGTGSDIYLGNLGSDWYRYYFNGGSSCDGNNCSFIFTFNHQGYPERGVVSFPQPQPASDWAVYDGVIWNQVGSIFKKKIHAKK